MRQKSVWFMVYSWASEVSSGIGLGRNMQEQLDVSASVG